MRKLGNVAIAMIVAAAAFGMGRFVTPAAAEGGGHEACKADVQKLCPDSKPGDGSIRTCLHDHEADLSDGCKQAMAQWKGHHGHHHGGGSRGGDSGAAPSGGDGQESGGAAQ